MGKNMCVKYMYMCVKLNHSAMFVNQLYFNIFFFFFKEGRSLREVGVWGDGRKFEFGIAENKRGIDENKLGILGPC